MAGLPHLVARIQIAALETRELSEPVQVVNLDAAPLQGEQIELAQLSQDAVDMDSSQSQRVSENKLAKRAFELSLGCQPHQAQPFSQLHEEMGRALNGIAPPDIDEMLNHHGFVAGGCPHERRPETRDTR